MTTQSCITGVEDAKPGLCCDTPNDPQCGPGGGGGDVACQLDCRKVCADVAPGVQGGFENCYWGTGVNAGKIQYVCGACGVGRIPGDLAPCDEGTTVGERLAMQAYYEAASVVAFERLAATLEASGAPSALVSRARRAAEEERAHAALFAKLARERGATVPALRFQPASESEPDLNALAVENATEGCVRETYGALVAMHQGLHAAEPAVRAAFASVADDEIDHAALSWELTAWLEARMPSEARAHVVASRAAAQRELRRSLQRFLTPIERALGLPEREVALSMFDAIVLSGAALSEAA